MLCRYNKHGTLSIELLSTMMVPEDTWNQVKSKAWALWTGYTTTDPLDGRVRPLRAKPHWAKEAPYADEARTIKLLQDLYKDEMGEFGRRLGQIAAMGGYGLLDLKQNSTRLLKSRSKRLVSGTK